jgi:hypothetical protein
MSARTLITLAIALTVSLPSNSQETWKGLRFGMTVKQVRANIQIKREPGDVKPGEAFYSGPDVMLYGLKLSSALVFSPNLSDVELLYVAPPSESNPSVGQAKDIATELKAKYGSPIEESHGCEHRSQNELSCDLTWSHQGQLIYMTYQLDLSLEHFYMLGVKYQPQSKDL